MTLACSSEKLSSYSLFLCFGVEHNLIAGTLTPKRVPLLPSPKCNDDSDGPNPVAVTIFSSAGFLGRLAFFPFLH